MMIKIMKIIIKTIIIIRSFFDFFKINVKNQKDNRRGDDRWMQLFEHFCLCKQILNLLLPSRSKYP